MLCIFFADRVADMDWNSNNSAFSRNDKQNNLMELVFDCPDTHYINSQHSETL